MYLFIVFCKDLLCVPFPFWLKDFHLCVYIFCFCQLRQEFALGHIWHALALVRCVCFMSYMYFQSFICFSFDSRTPGVPGRHGRSDGLGVITRTIDHCTSPHCQRVVPSTPYPFIFSIICTTEYPTRFGKSFRVTNPHTWLLWCEVSLV